MPELVIASLTTRSSHSSSGRSSQDKSNTCTALQMTSSDMADGTQQQQQQEQGSSVFVAVDAPVYDMPISAINRPLQSQLDPEKVQQFVADMQTGATFTPIEVAHVTGGACGHVGCDESSWPWNESSVPAQQR